MEPAVAKKTHYYAAEASFLPIGNGVSRAYLSKKTETETVRLQLKPKKVTTVKKF